MRVALSLSFALLACSGSSANGANDDAATDAASADTGAPVDATAPMLTLLPAKALVIVDTAIVPPTPSTQTYTAVLHDGAGDTDVTAEVALSVANPTLGSFASNRFTSEILPKDPIWGATDTVRGKARGTFGEATLTVAWFKATGNKRVMFFQAPTGDAPAPARDVMPQVVPAGGPYDISYLTVNDPRNPPENEGGAPIDAQPLLGRVRAMKEGDAKSGCPPVTTSDTNGDGVDDTFVGAPGGSTVCFEITPAKNDALTTSMFLDAYIDVVEKPSDHIIQLRTVLFFVPP